MRWQDVGYILDGFYASVIFDVPGGRKIHVAGVIRCTAPGVFPILDNRDTKSAMAIPPYAVIYQIEAPSAPEAW